MSRSPLFSRVHHLIARGLFASSRGITDPREATRAFDEERARFRAAHKDALDRRTFLKRAAAASGAMALAPLVEGCGPSPDGDAGPGDESRVLVIGAGIAGLHAAYRLHETGVDVTIFDAADRVGGRMFTGRGLYPDGLLCELGGELIDTNHATLWALAEELDIVLDDRVASFPVGTAMDTWWVNGALVDDATLVSQMIAVAPTMQTDVTAADSDDAAFETLDNTTLESWLLTNVPPAQYRELHDVLSTAYRGEFGLENDEQSALNLLYLIDSETPDPFRIFGDSDERYHTHDGNDVFPTKLAEPLGERVKLEHRLTALTDRDGGGYVCTFSTPDGDVEEECDHVVLALPFTLLRDVNLTGLTLSDEKKDIIDNLGYGTNAKVMGGFASRPWWTTHGSTGSLTCDLPVQQTWDSTVGQEVTSGAGVLTNFLGGDQGVASAEGTPEAWMTSVVLPSLETVWPGTTAAYTADSAVRMHWPTAPFAKGSYTCYRPGQWAYWSTEGTREGNVHFCGEHCSLDFQGWMEGAAETGALVAAEVLEDLSVTPSSGLSALLAILTVVPQPWARFSMGLARLTPFARRRRLREILRGL